MAKHQEIWSSLGLYFSIKNMEIKLSVIKRNFQDSIKCLLNGFQVKPSRSSISHRGRHCKFVLEKSANS